MALNLDRLSVMSYALGHSHWVYASSIDSTVDMLALGYFDRARTLLRSSDLLTLIGVDTVRQVYVAQVSDRDTKPDRVTVRGLGETRGGIEA